MVDLVLDLDVRFVRVHGVEVFLPLLETQLLVDLAQLEVFAALVVEVVHVTLPLRAQQTPVAQRTQAVIIHFRFVGAEDQLGRHFLCAQQLCDKLLELDPLRVLFVVVEVTVEAAHATPTVHVERVVKRLQHLFAADQVLTRLPRVVFMTPALPLDEVELLATRLLALAVTFRLLLLVQQKVKVILVVVDVRVILDSKQNIKVVLDSKQRSHV